MFYLEDHSSKAILIASNDVFLLGNIRSGILDCYLKKIDTVDKKLINLIKSHSNLTPVKKGIRLINGGIGLSSISLENFPETKNKYDLIRIRQPAFEILLDEHKNYISRISLGFQKNDYLNIHLALSHRSALEFYAKMTGVGVEFAEQELTLLKDSYLLDYFKLFSLCTMWKKKINNAKLKENIDELIPLIKKSFAY